MYCPTKTLDVLVAQIKPIHTQIISIHICPNHVFFKIAMRRAEITKGNTQYPRIHTDWKKETAPSRSWAFIVTTAAPIDIEQNTAENTIGASSFGALMDRRIERERQTINGPLSIFYEIMIRAEKLLDGIIKDRRID